MVTGDGLDHAGEVGRGDGGVAEGGVADAVGGALQGVGAFRAATWVQKRLDEPGLYAFGHKVQYSNWYGTCFWDGCKRRRVRRRSGNGYLFGAPMGDLG